MENVITAIFPVENEAYRAFSETRHAMLDPKCIIAQLVLVKKQQGGKIAVCDAADSALTFGDDTAAGGLLGMFTGLLGGPVGVLLGGTFGAAAGMTVDTAEAARDLSLVEQVSTKLLEGDTAMIALAQESDETVFDARLSAYQTTIIRHDAAVVAAEVERALEVQAELAREAKRKMHEEKKAEIKQTIAAKRDELQAKFQALKDKIASKVTEAGEALQAKADELKSKLKG